MLKFYPCHQSVCIGFPFVIENGDSDFFIIIIFYCSGGGLFLGVNGLCSFVLNKSCVLLLGYKNKMIALL